MTRIRLDYVHEYNRRGRIYRYFRRPGSKQIRLRGVPGSQEFMEAYQAALDGQPTPEKQIGAKRTRPGTVTAAVVGYYTCLAFRSLALSTQKMRRAILERFREDHGERRADGPTAYPRWNPAPQTAKNGRTLGNSRIRPFKPC